MINRFNQPTQNAGYTPLSFQELAFAPVQMRQREDVMANQQDAILHEMNNIVGYEGFDEETNALKAKMEGKLNDLTGKIQKNGVGNYQDEFRNLRNEYNGLVSKTGAIGMSSAVKENLDSQKAAYYQIAMARGQSPADIDRDWKKQSSLYTQQLPGQLSKHKGQLPTFDPMLPPQHQDLAVHTARLHTLMGSIKDSWGKVSYETEWNEETQENEMVIRDVKGDEITNEPNIEKFKEYMKTQILNPNSALGQDMAYKNISVDDVLNQVDLLGDLMLTKASSEVTKESGKGLGDGTNSTRTGSDKSEIGDASLVSADGNSSERVPHTESSNAIRGRMEAIKRDDDRPEKDKEHELTSLRQSLRVKSKQESDPKFVKAMDAKIKGNDYLKDLGIKSWSDYQAARDNPELNKKESLEYNTHNTFGTGEQKSVSTTPYEQATTIVDKMYDESEFDNPVLAESDMYTFGSEDNDIDLAVRLGKAMPLKQLESLMMANQVSLFNNDAGDAMYDQIEPQGDLHQKVLNGVRQGDVKFTFGAINSGSEMAGPEVMFTMEVGTGDDAQSFDLSLNLKESGYGEELLDQDSTLWKSLDQEGRAKIDAIRDNMAYAGLSTHSLDTDGAGEIYNKNKTVNIRALSKKRTDEQFKYEVKNVKDPSPFDEEVLKSQFIKDDGYDYGVRVNPDGSYSTYKSEPGSGREEAYTFEDYINKQSMATYTKARMKEKVRFGAVKDHTYENLTGAAGKAWKQKQKVAALDAILENTSNINDLENNLIIYNKSKGFMDGIQEWYMVRDSLDPAEKIAKANEIFGKIKDYPVQSKRKKMIL